MEFLAANIDNGIITGISIHGWKTKGDPGRITLNQEMPEFWHHSLKVYEICKEVEECKVAA